MKSEILESRICLAASAVVIDGDLVITGDAVGDIEIIAVGDGLFEVYEDGVLVADSTQLQDVTDDIRISLEATTEDADDNVSIDLGDEAVDQVYADLGDGDNSLVLIGGSAVSLVYRGGDGVDDIQLDTAIEEIAWFVLGDGANTLTVNGAVGRLNARDGDDTLVVSQSADVADNLCARLGDGENAVTVEGTVGGDVNVTSSNAEDESRMIVEEGNVAGEIRLSPGEQSSGYYHFSPGRGRMHHHFHGFRYGRP